MYSGDKKGKFYIRNFCNRNLDIFTFSPSTGASGGLLTVWNSHLYQCDTVQSNNYAITLKVTCLLDQSFFHLTNVYGPAHVDGKLAFVTWLINLDSFDFEDWIIVGDFNLYRSPKNRNKPRGVLSKMQLFNDMILDLNLLDIPLSRRHFIFCNM
jgi:hypothetical protein